PVPGASVGHRTSGHGFATSALFVLCDAEGVFVYDGAPSPGEAISLEAFAPNFVNETRTTQLSGGNRPLELQFHLRPKPSDRPGMPAPGEKGWRTVSGVVRGPDGKPVPGALATWGFDSAIEARTDDAGRFRLTVPDGASVVPVMARDLTPGV